MATFLIARDLQSGKSAPVRMDGRTFVMFGEYVLQATPTGAERIGKVVTTEFDIADSDVESFAAAWGFYPKNIGTAKAILTMRETVQQDTDMDMTPPELE